MIKNPKFQKFVTATMLGTFLALAASPVLASFKENGQAMQEQAVASAQAEAQDQAKFKKIQDFLNKDTINQNEETILNLKNTKVEFNNDSIKSQEDAKIAKEFEDENLVISRHIDDKENEQTSISFKKGTSFQLDEDYLLDFEPTANQIDFTKKVVNTVNDAYKDGFFTDEIHLEVNLFADNAYSIKNLKDTYKTKVENSIKNEAAFKEKQDRANEINKFLNDVNSEDISLQQIEKLMTELDTINAEAAKLDYVPLDRAEYAYNSVSSSDLGIVKNAKVYDSLADHAQIPNNINVGYCKVNMFTDQSGLSRDFVGSSRLNPTFVQNEATMKFMTEFVTLHEMSHCKLEVLDYKINTDNQEINQRFNDLFFSGKLGDGSKAKFAFHEHYADTYSYMVMLKKYGKDDANLNQFATDLTEGRLEKGDGIHMSHLSMKIATSDHMKEIILNTPTEQLSDLAIKISSEGFVSTFAHSDYLNNIISNNMGVSAFNSGGFLTNAFEHSLGKASGINPVKLTETTYNQKFVNMFDKAISNFIKKDPNNINLIKEITLQIYGQKNYDDDVISFVKTQLWADKDFRTEYQKLKTEYKADVQNLKKIASNYQSTQLSKLNIDAATTFTEDNHKVVSENLTAKKFEFNAEHVQQNLDKILSKYSINKDTALAQTGSKLKL